MSMIPKSLGFVVFLASMALARGWTVSSTDSLGANFTSLQKAIDSAAANDTLWLDHGNWTSNAIAIPLSKPLVFIGRQANSTTASSFSIQAFPEAAGSAFWGVNLQLHGNVACVSGIEVGYSTLSQQACLDGAYIHHSRLTGNNYLVRSSRFQNNLMDRGSFLSGSNRNIFDHVTIDEGGIAGLELFVSNSVMSRTTPAWYDVGWYQWAKESHYRKTLLWNVDSVELENTAVGCRFTDSSLHATGPFSSGYRVKPEFGTMSEDGTEPGIYGGKSPLRFVGNENSLIPLMPLPWLRTVALERLRVKSSDSVNVFLEAQSGR